MNVLPSPKFVDNDPAVIEADLIARYEAKSGKTLHPAQVERLLIDLIAYAKSRVLSAVQHTGEQMLVRRSQAPIIDYLGDLVGTQRLLAQAARCTFEFGLPAPQPVPQFVGFGTRILSQDGRVAFVTDEDLTIEAGAISARVAGRCETVGSEGNGWALGALSVLEASALDSMTVRNVSVPSGGADDETTAAYAERIILAPEGYSTAGPGEAYEVRVRAVHQDIVDVAVLGPEDGLQDGHVEAYPLTQDGLPSQELLDQVQMQVNQRKRRPLTDYFQAKAPVEVVYRIKAGLVLLRGVDADTVMRNVQVAAQRYRDGRRAKLGRDLVRSQLSAALHVPGVYEVRLDAGFENRVLARQEWATCEDIELDMLGVHDE